ncbi:thioredoxin family protein [Catenulispora rubra]|uniref:thioredoxin family protein n=1 Tax=Catenulispora rubra TaxID=280293 RepID=UPI001892383F|nr:thioredoxin family protein [Catenulispora rubra]
MRKTMTALTISALAIALAGCASTATPQPAAAGSDASSQTTDTATTSQPSTPTPITVTTFTSSTPTARPTATPPTHRTTSSPARAKSTTAPSAPQSTPTPGTAPTSFGYSPTANAKAEIDAARAAARADGREVLLDFGASWCGNCVAMDAAFHTPRVRAELASSYHLVQVDVDVDANMGLLGQYAPNNSGGYGLPVIIVLSPTGTTRVDTDKSGNPSFDSGSFLTFLKKWAL